MGGVALVQALLRRIHDGRHVDRALERGLEPGRHLAGDDGEGHQGEVGLLVEERLVHPLIIGGQVVRQPVDEQAGRPVRDGIVELQFPGVLVLVEDELEMDRHALVRVAVIGPDLGRKDVVVAGDLRRALRRAEDDVHAPAVGHPSLAGRAEPESVVGLLEALEMLVLVFVFGRPRRGVAHAPERLDEEVAVAVRRQVEEDVPFLVHHDVGHELEPILVLHGQVLGPDLGLPSPEGRPGRERQDQSQKGRAGPNGFTALYFPHNFIYTENAHGIPWGSVSGTWKDEGFIPNLRAIAQYKKMGPLQFNG